MAAEERLELLQQGLRIEALVEQLAADEQGSAALSASGSWLDRSVRSAWIGAAVGICSALRTGDWLGTCQAGLAFALAKGSPSQALVAEALGRSEGTCHGRSGLAWLVDRTRRLAAWPEARLALLTSLGWAQAQESLALAVVPEDAEPALVGACLRRAAERELAVTVISIATHHERDPTAPPAIRCADLESITQAVHQGTTRARDRGTATHVRLWLPVMPSMVVLGQAYIEQGLLNQTDLAALTRLAERESQAALTVAHSYHAPRAASAFQYVW